MQGLTKKEVLAELTKFGFTKLSELREHLREYERYAESVAEPEDMDKDSGSASGRQENWF